MKKIFIGLVMLVALVSCNAKISDKLKNQMNGKESVTEGNSIDKYNANVDFHSRLASNFSNQIDDYLLEFGQEKNLKVKDSDPSFNASDLTSEIARYKEAIGKGPSFAVLDDNAKKMLPILEELNKVNNLFNILDEDLLKINQETMNFINQREELRFRNF